MMYSEPGPAVMACGLALFPQRWTVTPVTSAQDKVASYVEIMDDLAWLDNTSRVKKARYKLSSCPSL